MCTRTREELETSRPIYSISFDHFHLGTAISSSLEGFEFITDKTINSSAESIKQFLLLAEKSVTLAETSVTKGFDFAGELLKFSKENHAPFENFLRTWYYIPLTVWWTTFASPMFGSVNMFADKAEKWTINPLCLLVYGPFLAMLKEFAEKAKDKVDSQKELISTLIPSWVISSPEVSNKQSNK